MSHLSLLFTSAMQGMANDFRKSRESETDVRTAPDALERARIGMRGEADDYRLPSGIASLEHWLDLNA
ncbi:MAG TPA: hypothetical protein VMF69_22280 [Gemmataceae bacterium]|nr:hypothetical protein [Gemmataceae bacterium]